MFTKKKSFKGAILFLAGIFILSGCSTATTGENKLRLAVGTEITTLDSLTVSIATSAQVIGNFTEGLTTYSEEGKIVGAIAEKWNISEDQLTYNFTLRDAKWENGEKVTAADFVFAWQKVATLPTSSYKMHLRNFENGVAVAKGEKPASELGVTALSENELQIKLIQPTPFLLDLLAFPSFLPVNEKFYEEVGADNYGTSKETVLANGPFKLETFASDTGYTLVKNPDYWDVKNVGLDAVDVRVVKQAETQASLYDSGELDALTLTTNLSDKYSSTGADIVKELQPRLAFMYLSGNTKVQSDLLSNKNFRQAVAHAIDKELITDKVLKDGSIPAEYVLPKGLVELEGKDFRSVSGKFDTPIFDVTKAKTFLDTAKSELGDTPLVIDFATSDAETNKKVFESIKSQIETNLPGVVFNINSIPAASYNGILREHATPAASTGWVAGFRDPSTFFEIYQTGQVQNYSNYSNPEFDALIKKTESAELAKNPEARWDAFVEAEEVLLDDFILMPLYQQGQQSLIQPYVKGLKLSPTIPSVFYKYVTIKR